MDEFERDEVAQWRSGAVAQWRSGAGRGARSRMVQEQLLCPLKTGPF
jgi:hypothetical protein